MKRRLFLGIASGIMLLVLILAYGCYYLGYVTSEEIIWFPAVFVFIILILTVIREYLEKNGMLEK